MQYEDLRRGVPRGTRLDPEIRFTRRISVGSIPSNCPNLGPCILWDAVDKHGYGSFFYDGRARKAHHYAWERVNGPLPAGLVIDHLCRVRRCVNVRHLEPVTAGENTIRGNAPSMITSRLGVCARGHSMEDAYVRKTSDGKTKKRCRACAKDWARRDYLRKRNQT